MLSLRSLTLLSCIALSTPVLADYSKVLTLLQQGDTAAAFELGTDLLPEFAGEAEFDLAYAKAALELGKFDDAVFTLERVLWIDPNNSAARILLAQTYLDLEAFELAREQSKLVLIEVDTGDTQDQAVTIYKLADAQMIDQEASLKYGQLSLSAGYDSNYNAQTDPHASLTQNTTLKLGVISRITPEFKSRFELAADQETFARSSSSNNHGLKIKLGGDYEVANSRTRFEVSAQRDWRDDKANQDIYSAKLGYRYAFTNQINAEVYSKYSIVDHKRFALGREGWSGGVLSTVQLEGNMEPLLFASIFWSDTAADSMSGNIPALIDSENLGVQFGARLKLSDAFSYTAVAVGQRSQFSGKYGTAATNREDGLQFYVNTLEWDVTDQHAIALEWSHRENDSNTAQFDYDRDQLMLTYTYNWWLR